MIDALHVSDRPPTPAVRPLKELRWPIDCCGDKACSMID